MTAITRSQFDTETEEVFENLSDECFWSEAEREKLYIISNRLLLENESFNLTAVRTYPGVIEKHLYDSVSCSEAIPENATVIDIGTGAGFPALPLAVVRKDLKITALDSNEKKVDFVKRTSVLAKLTNIDTICGRAEEITAERPKYREKFDVAIARSVASLPILCELCLPFVKVGGIFIAMKSRKAEHETAESETALRLLGGSKEIREWSLYETKDGDERMLYVIRKEAVTPAAYPRKFAQIKKKPL